MFPLNLKGLGLTEMSDAALRRDALARMIVVTVGDAHTVKEKRSPFSDTMNPSPRWSSNASIRPSSPLRTQRSLAQDRHHFESGGGCLTTLCSHPWRTFERLIEGVDGEHAEDDRHAGAQLDVLHARAHSPDTIS